MQSEASEVDVSTQLRQINAEEKRSEDQQLGVKQINAEEERSEDQQLGVSAPAGQDNAEEEQTDLIEEPRPAQQTEFFGMDRERSLSDGYGELERVCDPESMEQSSLPKHYIEILQLLLKLRLLPTNTSQTSAWLTRLTQCLLPSASIVFGSSEDFTAEDSNPRSFCIDLSVIRTLCEEGLPNECSVLRGMLWKLVLGYLPIDVFQWDAALSDSHKTYKEWVKDLLNDEELASAPGAPGTCEGTCDKQEEESDRGHEGHAHGSTHVENLADVFDQVNKDVFRTQSELGFFCLPLHINVDTQMLRSENDLEHRKEDFTNIWEPNTHHDRLARILLLYARLNHGVQYVQGMNELCAVIYYVLIHDPVSSANAEAETFFLFNRLMTDMRDAFVKSLDHEEEGMIGRVYCFSDLLKEKDPEVWTHLDAVGLSPLFYAVRWIMLMLAQDLDMPDTLRVWDVLLPDDGNPHPLLLYLCVARLILIREALLKMSMGECLKMVQNYPPCRVDEMLSKAKQLRLEDSSPSAMSRRLSMTRKGIAQFTASLKQHFPSQGSSENTNPSSGWFAQKKKEFADSANKKDWMRAQMETYGAATRSGFDVFKQRLAEKKEIVKERWEAGAESSGGGVRLFGLRRTRSPAEDTSATAASGSDAQESAAGYGGDAQEDSTIPQMHEFEEMSPIDSSKPRRRASLEAARAAMSRISFGLGRSQTPPDMQDHASSSTAEPSGEMVVAEEDIEWE